MAEHRNSVRTPFRSRIRIKHESFGEIDTTTRDISDNGVFLFMDDVPLPDIGSIVKGQILDLPGGNAPVVDMIVVRYDPEGIGLRFYREDED